MADKRNLFTTNASDVTKWRVYNDTGSRLDKDSLVTLSGSRGDAAKVVQATATDTRRVVILASDIDPSTYGEAVVRAFVAMDTSAGAVGDDIFWTGSALSLTPGTVSVGWVTEVGTAGMALIEPNLAESVAATTEPGTLTRAAFTGTTTTDTLGRRTHYAQTATLASAITLTLSDTTKSLATATNPIEFVVFDESGSVNGTDTLTLSPESGTINGTGSSVINVAYGSAVVYTDGTNWFVR